MKKLLMGNEAIGLGAIRAGVTVVSGYPGTPSTEVIETIAKHNDGHIYVEWSVNEKAGMEVAAGAAYAGARTLVTMKQVGLNVASDPLMSLAYIGVKGGMVVFVADDPGPISSQTEQDTRTFAKYAKLPIFDPTCPEEAYLMMKDAFEFSEQYHTPVLFRATTRICHACAAIDVDDSIAETHPEGFVKSPNWVIFPRLSYGAHLKIEERNLALTKVLSDYPGNTLTGAGTIGIAAGGVSWAYLQEALRQQDITDVRLLKVATPHPFPEELAARFLDGLTDVLVFEELDPVIERELVSLCGLKHLAVNIHGKRDNTTIRAGENSTETIAAELCAFLGKPLQGEAAPALPKLPVRPPVLCAGCPHRASFYAVKQAMKGRKALFSGDIGCYTLGNAMPLDMTDTCLCMGAGITLAQGIGRVDKDTVCFSFTGDSTFFASGLTGIANAVYNGAHMVAVILDNHSTAMTGHQPNPSTGRNAMGEVAEVIDIEAVLKGLGVKEVLTADPLDLPAAIETVKKAADLPGVSAVIFRSPCIAVCRPKPLLTVDAARCIGCRKCIRELGCPALMVNADKTVRIDASLCYGCGICAYVCPTGAIGGVHNA